jgi:hypothetical protein
MVFDALGKEIVLGERYGYSNRANGNVTVVIGRAIKINEETSNVTLSIERKLKGIYNSDLRDDQNPGNGKSSVLSNTIFPLKNEPVCW